MKKPNLIEGSEEDIRDFVVAVVGLAAKDHRDDHFHRSGEEILNWVCGPSRIFHARMATGIYNNTRKTMVLMDRLNAGEEI